MGYYENMHDKAIKHCNRVASAKAECETANTKIQVVLQSVSENWQGQAGTAYYNALSEWLASLQSIITRLDSLEVQMRQEAEMVLTYWPQAAQDVLAEQNHVNPEE